MTDKKILREVAERVDCEKWEVLNNGDDEYQVIVSGSLESGASYRSYQPVTNEISEQKIAAFIAAFNPATVLAILDELEADKEQIKTLESRNRRLEGIIDAAEKHTAEINKLNAELTAKIEPLDRRIAELQIARDKNFLSCLKTGWEYGIADDAEGYNACHAALLERQSVDHVVQESLTTTQTSPELDSSPKSAGSLTTLEEYRELAGVMYQAAGAYDMPERIMNLLSAAQGGQPFGRLLDVLPVYAPGDLVITLPDTGSKAFWSGTGKNEVFLPETYKRQVKEVIERDCVIARIDVEVK